MEFECNQTEQKLDTFHLQIPKNTFGKNLDIAKKLQSKMMSNIFTLNKIDFQTSNLVDRLQQSKTALNIRHCLLYLYTCEVGLAQLEFPVWKKPEEIPGEYYLGLAWPLCLPSGICSGGYIFYV